MAHIRDWLSEVTDSASLRSVADRIGEYNVTFTRRIDAGDAHTITAVARAYGVNPIPGLITAGIITEADLEHFARKLGIKDYDDLELAEEMVERIKDRPSSPLATVTEFPQSDDEDDGTVSAWDDDEPAVADGSADEDAGREAEGADPHD